MRAIANRALAWCMCAAMFTASNLTAAAPCGQSSTTEDNNKQVVTEAFHRWAAGGTSFFDDVLAENVVWRIKGSSPAQVSSRVARPSWSRRFAHSRRDCPLSSARLPYGSGPMAIM